MICAVRLFYPPLLGLEQQQQRLALLLKRHSHWLIFQTDLDCSMDETLRGYWTKFKTAAAAFTVVRAPQAATEEPADEEPPPDWRTADVSPELEEVAARRDSSVDWRTRADRLLTNLTLEKIMAATVGHHNHQNVRNRF